MDWEGKFLSVLLVLEGYVAKPPLPSPEVEFAKEETWVWTAEGPDPIKPTWTAWGTAGGWRVEC